MNKRDVITRNEQIIVVNGSLTSLDDSFLGETIPAGCVMVTYANKGHRNMDIMYFQVLSDTTLKTLNTFIPMEPGSLLSEKYGATATGIYLTTIAKTCRFPTESEYNFYRKGVTV